MSASRPHRKSMTEWGKFFPRCDEAVTCINVIYADLLYFRSDFRMEDGRAEIPLNVTVQGDVLIVIYHARATLGGRLQAKVWEYVLNLDCKLMFYCNLRLQVLLNHSSYSEACVVFLQMASMKMFQIQFHSGFVPRNASTVKFAKLVSQARRII